QRVAFEPDFCEGLFEQAPRRPDEGMSLAVFLVASLLADDHASRVGRSFAEHGLRGRTPEVAGAAIACGRTQAFEGLLRSTTTHAGLLAACNPGARRVPAGGPHGSLNTRTRIVPFDEPGMARCRARRDESGWARGRLRWRN